MRAVAAVGIVLFLGAAGVAGGAGSASLIVDRTLICNIPGQDTFPDPIRTMTVSATPRLKGGWSPSVGAFTLNSKDKDELAVGLTTGSTPRVKLGYVAWSRPPKCTVTSRRFAFSSRGLEGGPAPQAHLYDCDVPAKVVVRVRGVFTRPVTIVTDARVPTQFFAKGNISTGQLMVATLKGKRLAYASADGKTGKVTIFAAGFPRCDKQ
jgi:hypothetical protein